MAFNRSSVNLGNQFAHAAAVSRGEERENSNRARDYYNIPVGMGRHKWTEKEERFNILLAKNNASDPDLDDGTKGGENWDRIKPYLPKDRVLY